MKWPLVFRRTMTDALTHQARGYGRLIEQVEKNNHDALAAVATELSGLKDEVALHIVAAEHPSSASSDAASMALALREALEARDIDLRLELHRLEGSDL
jgi:hypothetical protein